jgi:hypothetical protein
LLNFHTPIEIIQALIRDDTLDHFEPRVQDGIVAAIVENQNYLTSDDLEYLAEIPEVSASTREEIALHLSSTGSVLRIVFSRTRHSTDLLDLLLKQRPLVYYSDFWQNVLREVGISRLISWEQLPGDLLEDFMNWYERNGKLTGNYFGTNNPDLPIKILRHVNATAAVFSSLLTDDNFLHQDWEQDHEGLYIILEHPNATPAQRADAMKILNPNAASGLEN